jgi:uncharacterized protein YrrD
MELKEGTDVFTSSGEQVGRINRFILHPETNEVTHVVVQKGWLLPDDKVIPMTMINTATEDRVELNPDIAGFDELPSFEDTQYVELTPDDVPPTARPGSSVGPAYYWYPPSGYIGYPAFGPSYYGWPPLETTRNIPEDTIPLEEGSDVVGSDGEQIGNIERLVVDADSHRATHFVISSGGLFKERKLVPAHWVRTIEENKVYLVVSSRLLDRLPDYQP